MPGRYGNAYRASRFQFHKFAGERADSPIPPKENRPAKTFPAMLFMVAA